jgi:hypothetical protein
MHKSRCHVERKRNISGYSFGSELIRDSSLRSE